MEINIERIENEAVQQVVERITDSYSAGDAVAKRIEESLKKQLSEMVDHAVTGVACSKLDALVFQRTTEWGEQKGSPETIREWISRQINQILDQKVDCNGKPSSSSYDRQTYMDWLVKETLGSFIRTNVVSIADQYKSKVSEAMSRLLKAALDDAVSRLG